MGLWNNVFNPYYYRGSCHYAAHLIVDCLCIAGDVQILECEMIILRSSHLHCFIEALVMQNSAKKITRIPYGIIANCICHDVGWYLQHWTARELINGGKQDHQSWNLHRTAWILLLYNQNHRCCISNCHCYLIQEIKKNSQTCMHSKSSKSRQLCVGSHEEGHKVSHRCHEYGWPCSSHCSCHSLLTR